MNGNHHKALTHALIDIGFNPTSGRPYKDEIDVVWRKANRELKRNGWCVVTRNNQDHTIKLRQ
jgi:hypothetical protein